MPPALLIAAGVLPAAVRRRWPAAVLAVVVVGGAVATVLSASPGPALAAALVMYVIPLRFPRRDALVTAGQSLRRPAVKLGGS